MGTLPGLLPLLLGGSEQPWIVNLLPEDGDINVRVTDPVRFSVKDSLLHLNLGSLRAMVAYAKTRSDGSALFDSLPRTKRTSVFQTIDETAPTIALGGGGVQITKTTNNPQRAVFASAMDIGGASSRQNALITAIVQPNTETLGAQGAVLGLEYGPRNTGVYLFFQNIAGVKSVRVTGPSVNNLRIPNVVYTLDWSSPTRYIVLWNEMASPPVVELYSDTSGTLSIITSIPISSFQAMDATQPSSTPRLGGDGDIVGIYGQEGNSGDQVTFQNIAVSADVDFPILSGTPRGTFATTLLSDHLVLFPGGVDPRAAKVAPWFDPPTPMLPIQDPAGSISVLSTKEVDFSKVTVGQALSVYRQEPSLLRMGAEGLFIETTLRATPTVKDSFWTGAGFLFWDSATVYQVSLFDDAINKTVAIKKRGGLDNKQTDHFVSTAVNWSGLATVRIVTDPRRNLIEIFNLEDLLHPILSIPFDRTTLPVSADYGFIATEIPFISFGFPRQSNTTGDFIVSSLTYCYSYEAYEARDAITPDAASPAFVAYLNTGTPAVAGGALTLTTTPGQSQSYARSVSFDAVRGCMVEFDLAITNHKPEDESGIVMMLDDGIFSYPLNWVEKDGTKYVVVGTNLPDPPGPDGNGAKISFPLDWTVPHRYRFERIPLVGVRVFVDDEPTPRLTVSNSLGFPLTLFGTQTLYFGNGSTDEATSVWHYVRSFSGGGYEVSTRKDESVQDLRTELFDTQAVVLVTVSD